MQPSEIQADLLRRVEEASGKPVLLQSDPSFSGHATVKIARDHQPNHTLLYKPDHEAELPYLAAFQCSLALRTIQASEKSRFDLTSSASLVPDVEKMVTTHLRTNGAASPDVAPQLAASFGHGLGFQLRSMPIAICIDKQLHDAYPELRPIQRINVDRQLQENMQALSPSVKSLAPQEIIDASAAMNAAFAIFWAKLWNDRKIELPYVAAGYREVGQELLDFTENVVSPDDDKQLVDAWAKRLGLDRWFSTISRN